MKPIVDLASRVPGVQPPRVFKQSAVARVIADGEKSIDLTLYGPMMKVDARADAFHAATLVIRQKFLNIGYDLDMLAAATARMMRP